MLDFKKNLVVLIALFLLTAVALNYGDRGRYIFNRYGSPIAHYKCNDNAADTTVLDSIGNHDGTYKSAGGNANTVDHAAAGKLNGALDFVGDDDYFEIADHVDFTPALTAFSISAWVNMDDATSFVIASKGVKDTDGEWYLHTSATDKLYFVIVDENATATLVNHYDTALTSYQNEWLHIVATYDGSAVNTGTKLYLNGIKVVSILGGAGVFVTVQNDTHAVWIGRYNTEYSNGKIDNVMFFDTELTAGQAKRLYDIEKERTHDEYNDRERYIY